MKKSMKMLTCLCLIIIAMMPVAAAARETSFYTYNYDFYDIELESPDAYTVESLLIGSSLGIGDFKSPKSLFVRDERIYIVDSGNNRIVEVDKYFNLIREFDHVLINGEVSELKNPSDVFVSRDYEIYICDTDNNRVLHVDYDLNLIKTYTKPEDETVLAEQNFIPLKAVVDTAGRLYLLAGNVNKGFMEFSKDGEFTGYVGANPVKASFYEVIRKRLMTKEQRSRMMLFVPTEYSNVAIDKDNFLYATTTTFNARELYYNPEKVNPIRKINSLGEDILIKNGYEYPIGDVYWGTGGDISGPSRLEDITPMDNSTYYAIDRVRGRIFGYDFQGNMLYAFGGLGNKRGYFQYPLSIESMGTDILVLDNRAASVTRFTLTEYGKLINKALAEYKEGRYEESAYYWNQVLHLNGNYDLAYIGIGRALLRQGEYEEAMKYFESKIDKTNYSKAFAQYRKQWVEANIAYLIGGFIALIILPKLIRGIRKIVKGGAQNS